MNKKILIIVIFIVSILVTGIIISTGSSIIYAPMPVILATIDFIGSEQEFRDLVESTEEAKLFRETFPDVYTQYYLEIGTRTMVLSNNANPHDTTMHFKQYFDRIISINYWCNLGDEYSFGKVNSVEDMKTSGCF